ncbi:MAG TPA: GNAT family N-acetyltransferase [Candidatus Binatia bacterium]|nr:GNAT family N-acetyltransferase [Candidatus Binatia bacterium]
MEYHLRPATGLDRDFLYRLHRVTMRDVIDKTWGWEEAWQRADFERRFRDYLAWVIYVEHWPVGTLCLEWRPDSLHVHEVQVLPEFQGRGIGTAVLWDTIEQGAARGFPVTLSVVAANPRAKQLYERLGFRVTGVEALFIHMKHDSRLITR